MRWLQSIAAELFGLFVDDGAFAVAIVVWMGVLWWLLPRLPINDAGKAILFVAGLVVIFVGSVLRRTRAPSD